MATKIYGYCPMGCGETLFLGSGGYVTCGRFECPRPNAVEKILEDRETEHVVTFSSSAFTVRHPLRERLDDALMECQLHEHIASLAGPPVEPGRYRACESDDASNAVPWSWDPVVS